MAAPATKTSQDLSGQWGLNKQLSDNPEPVLQLQGIGFLTRKAIGVASISIEINQYNDTPTPPSTFTDPATFLSVSQSASGLKGTSELRVLDDEIRDHTDWLFGSLKCHSRWVNVDEIIENDWLKHDWEEGERLVRTHVKNHKNGWEAIQICGFEVINSERRYCSRTFITKGDQSATCRLVYNYVEI
ncbi:unnamed protein product [Clonostachys solani]|uniref:LCCL domain-containing protein n=1 Tax=Clonostachys solani TaxID=160281 RepID=A0A9N9ZAK1_9HYPO|nr:unnamed protein product [Clonostachys solani]